MKQNQHVTQLEGMANGLHGHEEGKYLPSIGHSKAWLKVWLGMVKVWLKAWFFE